MENSVYCCDPSFNGLSATGYPPVSCSGAIHDDVIKCKHFPRYWPFVRVIHWSPMNSPHKGQWRGALMFSLIWAWINGWVNNREAGDLRRHRAHYDVIVMLFSMVNQWHITGNPRFQPSAAGNRKAPSGKSRHNSLGLGHETIACLFIFLWICYMVVLLCGISVS